MISPIAVAVNVGDYELVDALLNCEEISLLTFYRSDKC